MLDKTIPYKDIVMVADAAGMAALQPPPAPPGYRIRTYSPGDEVHWVRIEISVGEFDSLLSATARFDMDFFPQIELLPQRMLFACDSAGTPVATASVWMDQRFAQVPILSWIATRPEHQGKGLAKALVARCCNLAAQFYPGQDMYLHTQTWSHKAVLLYDALGFRMLKNRLYPEQKNQYEEAMELLKEVLAPQDWRRLSERAVSCRPLETAKRGKRK